MKIYERAKHLFTISSKKNMFKEFERGKNEEIFPEKPNEITT